MRDHHFKKTLHHDKEEKAKSEHKKENEKIIKKILKEQIKSFSQMLSEITMIHNYYQSQSAEAGRIGKPINHRQSLITKVQESNQYSSGDSDDDNYHDDYDDDYDDEDYDDEYDDDYDQEAEEELADQKSSHEASFSRIKSQTDVVLHKVPAEQIYEAKKPKPIAIVVQLPSVSLNPREESKLNNECAKFTLANNSSKAKQEKFQPVLTEKKGSYQKESKKIP